MVNLNPSKFFDPATLADLYQVEVDYPEGVTWRGPRPGFYSPASPATLTVDDVTFHLESDAKAWSFCLELVEAGAQALEWTQEDEHLDAASAEHGIQAIRRTILRLAELSARLRDIQVQQARSQDVGDQVREMESASSEEPYSVCIWCGELSPGLSERRWCPSCEAGACPQCGEEPLRGSGECGRCEQNRQDGLQERREQTERDQAELEEAEDARIYDLGQQVLDEVAPGVTIVRLGGGL